MLWLKQIRRSFVVFFLQIVKVTLDETEMDTFVFFLANKKVCSKMHKEMLDLVGFVFNHIVSQKFSLSRKKKRERRDPYLRPVVIIFVIFWQSLFCNEKKSVEKLGLPSNFQLLSEIGEATSAILDSRVRSLIFSNLFRLMTNSMCEHCQFGSILFPELFAGYSCAKKIRIYGWIHPHFWQIRWS